MKRLIFSLLFLLCSLSICAPKSSSVIAGSSSSQPLVTDSISVDSLAIDTISFQLLAEDKTLRKGVLENGVAYYIKYNSHPREKGMHTRKVVKSDQTGKLAIIVVGDIDINDMEARIRSDYENMAFVERRYQSDNPHRLLKNEWDIQYKWPIASSKQRHTTEVVYHEMMLSMIGDIFNVRLLRLREQMDNCPYQKAEFVFATELSGIERESLCLRITAKKGREQEARAIAREEIEKVLVRPFSDFEVNYAKQQFILAHTRIYQSKDELTNIAHVWRISNAFSQGNALPSIETEWRLQKELEGKITTAMCNRTIRQILY